MIPNSPNRRSRPVGSALLIACAIAVTSCNSEVELTGEDGGALPATFGGGGVSLTNVNNVVEANWTNDLVTGKPTFATQTLTFNGLCSRGTSTINAYLGGTLKASANCAADATFTVDVTASADGVHQYELRAVASGTENTSNALTYSLATDTIGPSSGHDSGGSYAASTATFTIDGTVTLSDGVSTVVETNGNTGSLNFSSTSGTFTYTTSLSGAGTTKTCKFVARDAVGNSSAAATIVVSLIPASLLAAVEIGAGFAVVGSQTSVNTLSTVTSASVMSTTQPLVGSGTGNRLYGGLGAISVQGP